MIYKIFYQDNHTQTPRRETTQTLYVDIDAKDELDGRIQARQLIEEKTDYTVEFIELLSDNHLEYEKKQDDFTIATI